MKRYVFVYRLEVVVLEAMSVVHEPRIRVAKERLGESEQASTTENGWENLRLQRSTTL